MRILIVAPRYIKVPGEFYQFPLGLGYISAVLKEEGHDVFCLNSNKSDVPISQLVHQAVRSYSPDICAAGAISPFLRQVKEIFKAARAAKPEIFNIVGGGVLSSDPEAALRLIDADAGVIGEGEETIVELCQAQKAHGDLSRVGGIVFSHKGVVQRTANRPPIEALGSIPWPDYEGFGFGDTITNQLPSDAYFLHATNAPRSIDMISGRSCPYYCTFCFHPAGKGYRERPLDDFFAELEFRVRTYNINTLSLVDELFSLKKARLFEFCERIKPLNVHWTIQLHVNSVDDAILMRMKDAGCTYISYGIESMSQPVLNSMKKRSTTTQIDKVMRWTYDRKLGIQGNIIFGDTAETLETGNESMDWWARNQRYMINVGRLQVYPGSPDYIEAVRDGLIENRIKWIDRQDVYLNISKSNDFDAEILGIQVDVAQKAILNETTPVRFVAETPHPVRGQTFNIVWDCPRCQHLNDYRGVKLSPTLDQHAIRLTCRGCLSRFDVRKAAASTAALSFRYRDLMATSGSLLLVAKRILKLYGALRFGRRNLRKAVAATTVLARAYALIGNPLDSGRHVAYAEVLGRTGAIGLAILHYKQALRLDPTNQRARQGLDAAEGGQRSDENRAKYFVSFSNASPPRRLIRERLVVAESGRVSEDFPEIHTIESDRRAETG
ncbi:MAG TPA: cobalamin-dependent protein [Bryobacteraceae bacterium]|jgi:radical SAM superfamily enzyme YgiQ (UPF0313 family)